jgi:hypothetical protein
MKEYALDRWILVTVLIFIASVAAIAGVVAEQRLDTIHSLEHQLVVQNVQLTKQANAAKAESYRLGIIACTNEDVAWLTKLANDYYGTTLGRIFRKMAENWTYDDDVLNQMVEDYMSDDYQ